MMCYKGTVKAGPVEKCTTTCQILDHFFRGGLPSGSITELTGEASASKTQLCLQLLLTCQLPRHLGGLDGNAVYFYTEGEPAIGRLRELAALLPYRLDPAAAAGLPQNFASNIMDGVYLEKNFNDGASLLGRLYRLRPQLEAAAPRKVKLLIIDSIAWLFRDVLAGENADLSTGAPGVESLSNRTELLFKISSLLRSYADEFNLAIVVTNQVMDAFNRGGGVSSGEATGHTAGLQLNTSGREVIPALGLAWANCVNTRIFLSKDTIGDRGATRILHYGPAGPAMQRAIAAGAAKHLAVPPQLRHMQIVFSPYLPQSKCAYVVEQSGIRGLHPSEVQAVPEQNIPVQNDDS